MNSRDLEMIEKAIDEGLREFADENIYLIPYNSSSFTSYFEDKQEFYNTPIKIYGIFDSRTNEYDYEQKKELDNYVVFQFSLKSLRDLNLVDANNLPIIDKKWRIKHKDKMYAIKKIDLDNPFKDIYLTVRVYCSLLLK